MHGLFIVLPITKDGPFWRPSHLHIAVKAGMAIFPGLVSSGAFCFALPGSPGGDGGTVIVGAVGGRPVAAACPAERVPPCGARLGDWDPGLSGYIRGEGGL